MFFFSPWKVFLDSWGGQMDFLGSIYWNYFTAVSLRNAVIFFFKKGKFGLMAWKKSDVSQEPDLPAEIKD